ncbi:hypothetical protein [Streptomyces sp. NPDC059597]|uniref:hypothetical protein n=1 Tax=Streptomyces sp. NPDC059597 TaxID=3346879 RepID=UPI0036904AD7
MTGRLRGTGRRAAVALAVAGADVAGLGIVAEASPRTAFVAEAGAVGHRGRHRA